MTASKALSALRQLLAVPGGWARADWALTLHMLEHLAPAFFAAERLKPELDAALAELEDLPADFPPPLDEHEAMARVDAVYLRTLRGLPAKPLDLASLTRWIDANATRAPLHAWFMAEASGTKKPFRTRYPFQRTAPLSHLYLLTHEVMLSTRFFSLPITKALTDTLDALEAALPGIAADREWDLAAEISFTLQAAGRTCSAAIAFEGPAGETPREAAHRTATALIAFASGIRDL